MTMHKKMLCLALSLAVSGGLAGCSKGDGAAPTRTHHESTPVSPANIAPVQAAQPAPARAEAPDPRWIAAIEQWREQREEELLVPHGLASLIGMHWLERDTHYIGSGPSNSIRLEVGPDRLGLLTRRNGEVWFTPQTVSLDIQVDEKPLTERILLHPEDSATPTIISFDQGQGAISLIRDGQRTGLRLTHAGMSGFSGLKYWPIDPHWRVTGAFLPHHARKTITLTDASGYPIILGNPGTVEFNHEGKQVQLEIFSDGNRPFFTIFFSLSADGARLNSRYLDFDPPKADGRMVLDFNRSYNPPCAFSHSIPCLLPPSGNYLNFSVDAGEKNYHPPTGAHLGIRIQPVQQKKDAIRTARALINSPSSLSSTVTSDNWR